MEEWNRAFDAALEVGGVSQIDCTGFVIRRASPLRSGEVLPRVLFERATFTSDVSFAGLRFSSDVSFEKVVFAGRVDFRGAKFHGSASFEDAQFGSEVAAGGLADEDPRVDFSETEFHQIAEFDGAVFLVPTSFEGARFESWGNFADTRWLAEASFDHVRQVSDDGGLFFISITLGANLSMASLRVSGDFQLSDVTWTSHRWLLDVTHCEFLGDFLSQRILTKGIFLFNFSRFHRTAVFRDIRVKGTVSFWHAEFLGFGQFDDWDTVGRLPSGVEYDAAAAEWSVVDFRHVVIRDQDAVRFAGVRTQARLDNVRLSFTDVSSLRFLNVGWKEAEDSWGGVLGSLAAGDVEPGVRVMDEEFLPSKPNRLPEGRPPAQDDSRLMFGTSLRHPLERVDFEHVSAIYKGLRESYSRNMRSVEAGGFYIRELEMRRISAGFGKAGLIGKARQVFSLGNAYRILSKYGESYHRAAAWLCLLFATFFALRSFHEPPPVALSSTVLGFFALQIYRGGVLDVIQTLVGLPVVALFGLAVRRSFARE